MYSTGMVVEVSSTKNLYVYMIFGKGTEHVYVTSHHEKNEQIRRYTKTPWASPNNYPVDDLQLNI